MLNSLARFAPMIPCQACRINKGVVGLQQYMFPDLDHKSQPCVEMLNGVDLPLHWSKGLYQIGGCSYLRKYENSVRYQMHRLANHHKHHQRRHNRQARRRVHCYHWPDSKDRLSLAFLLNPAPGIRSGRCLRNGKESTRKAPGTAANVTE
jgi:hypothetical protein